MTHSPLEIRPYRADDNAALTQIWYAASRIAHGFLGDETLARHRRLVAETYLPQVETWVACSGDQPVGFLGLIDSYIGGLFVAPDAQGMGVGRALIAHGLCLKGRLDLDVYTANRGALGFYTNLGFQEVDRRPQDKEGLPFEEVTLHLSS